MLYSNSHSFIHFRAQSSYSMLESALTVEKLVQLAKSCKMPALCLADRGNLFGSLEFALCASKSGVQPIHGAILNLAYTDNEFAEILLIAKDEIGYSNLLKLVSGSFTKNDRKICVHITLKDLVENNEGIIALSCYTHGITGKYLLKDQREDAVLWAKNLQEIFHDRFYFEIMRHNLENEKRIEESYIDIAAQLDIPLIATNQTLFSNIKMHDAHNVLLCIADGTTKDHEHRRHVSNQCYFKSKDEMIALFADLPSSIENTLHLAKRCFVMSPTRDPILPNFGDSNVGESDILREQAYSGLKARLRAKEEKFSHDSKLIEEKEYFARLDYELDIICRMNFAGYFLIVSDFIKWSKAQSISVGPGRGSGAGSIVAWSLLITDLDPMKFGLLFERFLNPERISMPDFDIDFCQERREEVINYVRAKYGDKQVGQIITFGKMQAKAVIKDVGRVLVLAYRYTNYLTELVPFNAVNPITLEQAIAEVPELKSAHRGDGLYNMIGEAELIKQVLETSLILEGLHRHTSVHAAGVIIAGQNLIDLVPVYKDVNSDMLIVQYSMKYAELAGLMKFDFLGLQTLTVISKSIELLKIRGTEIDINNIPFDDLKTYKMLSTGAGTGVFQFESMGMKDTLKRLQPDRIEDLIALGALYRPGPMENIPTYIACKHGRQAPDYLHEKLIPVLEETYGVIIYQEQVLEIAKILAGYSLGAADLLRRAMGKKIKYEMQAQEELFVRGAEKNGIETSKAKAIFAIVAKFAGYGFNKAHASAYGVISYQTAYLKANFPLEFLVTCLNLEIANNDKINLFIQEARSIKIPIIYPDINLSVGKFSLYNDSIVYGLAGIKNVTISFGDVVEKIRSKKLFKTIIDFVERIPAKLINRRMLENLIKSGCFDKLHDNRNQLLSSIPQIMAYATSFHNESTTNQFSLLSVSDDNIKILQDADILNVQTLGFQELEVLGLFAKHHPIAEYQKILTEYGFYNSGNLMQDLPVGATHIKIAGVIQKKDTRMSSRGRFIILQLSDQFGIFDITIYNEEVVRNYVELMDVQKMVVVGCDAFKDDGGIKLTARHFTTLEAALNNVEVTLKLYATNYSNLTDIMEIISKSETADGINCVISLFVQVSDHFFAHVKLPKTLRLSNSAIELLKDYSNQPLQ